MNPEQFPELSGMVFIKHRSYHFLYFSVIIFCLISISVLPLIKTEVTVKAKGMIRPVSERTEVKASLSGVIGKIYFKEGEYITEGSLLLKLQDHQTAERTVINAYDFKRCVSYIHDLNYLTKNDITIPLIESQLQSPLYRQQAFRYVQQYAIRLNSLKKMQQEWQTDSLLYTDHIISKNEYLNKKATVHHLEMELDAYQKEQLTLWEMDLQKFLLEKENASSQGLVFKEEMELKYIKAPVSGIIQKTVTRYEGSVISAGEVICMISPEAELMAECWVPSNDIGLLKIGQPVRFQVDAFNYNYFGTITGRLHSIDNDFSLINQQSCFKIRCTMNQKSLSLKNGFKGQLRKGLTITARLIIARRSLWQLLFDSVDNWLNPSAG